MLRDVLCKAYNIHIALAQIRCAGDPKKLASLPVPESAFSEKLESKGYDDFHKIFLFLLKQFQNKNYRRTGGDVYVQQLNSKKQFTHCWKRESSIREAIYKCITPRYAFPQAWRCAFKGGGRNITNAAQQLQECEEPEFRKITKDRKALAWDDGIYLMAEDQYRDHLSPDIPASLNCMRNCSILDALYVLFCQVASFLLKSLTMMYTWLKWMAQRIGEKFRHQPLKRSWIHRRLSLQLKHGCMR